MTIIPFDSQYRDDMIFMVLEAKNALNRIPRLNDDLLEIQTHYLDCGGMFWLALDEDSRVIGCIGYNIAGESKEIVLHRLYVKYTKKRQGIGTALLKTAEAYAKNQGMKAAYVHLGGSAYFESHQFYPKHGYQMYAPSCLKNFFELTSPDFFV